MLKSSLASLAVATALLTAAPPMTKPAEAGSLRKALVIGGTVVATGLVIRCGVRVSKGRSCL
jgi:hypothetical protein